MTERELRAALHRAPVDAAARERSWRVVQAAYRTCPPAPRPPRRRRWVGAALAACLVAALATVTATRAPTDALARWLREAVGAGTHDLRPVLGDVPGGGRLLVTAGRDTWVVAPDGGKRRLGRYAGASWSPQGRFVVAWHGGDLTALEPDGDVRWSLRGPDAVRVARWAPRDGYRVAYVAGGALRIVNGDGTGDRRYARTRDGVAPAWRPDGEHVLAYVDARGAVHAAAVDEGRQLWRTAPLAGVRALAWSPRGGRLLVLAAHRLLLIGRRGERLAGRALPTGSAGVDVAFSQSGRVALVRRDALANRSEAVVLDPAGGRERILFTAPGALGPIAWSPDGDLLLVPWPDADEWLFLAPRGHRPVRAVTDVAGQFAPGAERARFPSGVAWTGPPAP